jgi:hypothetical protein
MQKFIQTLQRVLIATLVGGVIIIVMVIFIPYMLITAPRYYRVLEQFWMAQLQFRGQWVTAQKLKQAARLSDDDIRMLLAHDRILDEYLIRLRSRKTCERINRITGRKIPRLSRLPSLSTVEFYEFLYQPVGHLEPPTWGKAFRLTLPTARM